MTSVECRGREWNLETDAGLNHHGTGRELCLYFGGLDPMLGGAYCGLLASARLVAELFELDDMIFCALSRIVVLLLLPPQLLFT